MSPPDRLSVSRLAKEEEAAKAKEMAELELYVWSEDKEAAKIESLKRKGVLK